MIVLKVPDAASLQGALERLKDFLIGNGISQECVFDSKLVACELLGNVLRHTDREAQLRGKIVGEFIELKVFSSEAFELPKEIVCSDVSCEHGRGLFLVQELCEGRIVSEPDGIVVKIRIER